MMYQASPMLWFRSDPLPELVMDPAIVIGGTVLQNEFFSFVAEQRETALLSMAVPFVGDSFVSEHQSLWDAMDHRVIEVRVVVRRQCDALSAKQQLSVYRWGSIQIGISRRLHAKMYSFVTDRLAAVTLVGSHNLSLPGSTGNLEAGVLMWNRRPSPAVITAIQIHNEIGRMLRQSALWFDSSDPSTLIA